MAKKNPAISTRLKTAIAEITDLKAQIEKLTKERDNEKSSKTMYYEKSTRLESEIEQVNLLLDVLPAAPSRKSTHDDSWKQKDYTLMTRLAGYLAAR